jgi:hypothetical protein
MRDSDADAERALRQAAESLPACFSEFTGAVVALERLERAR